MSTHCMSIKPYSCYLFANNHGSITPVVSLCISPESWWFSAPLLGIQGYLCLRIILALRPAIPYLAKKDDCSDIPLTPTQRALLGLPPSTNPTPASAATGVAYITPPRYRYVSGSSSDANSDAAINDRRSVSANYSNSPLSASRYTLGLSPTPQSNRRTPGSPFQPSPTASPLFHKAANQKLQRFPDADFSASTQSFGHSTGSGLGRSQSLRERSRRDSFEPTSPTAGTSNPQMVPGVNYKWLYAKWRTLPKSESFGSFGL